MLKMILFLGIKARNFSCTVVAAICIFVLMDFFRQRKETQNNVLIAIFKVNSKNNTQLKCISFQARSVSLLC